MQLELTQQFSNVFMTQLELPLIRHQTDLGIMVPQRISDGYVNATELCKSADKEMHDYLRLSTTKAFLEELASVTGIPGTLLVHKIQGGKADEQGTWVHPDVAINLGQWLSPRFAVAVSQWVREWITGKSKAQLPPHIRRFLANRDKIPHTHFSILNEMFYTFIGALEGHGYTLPEEIVPDISMGRMFSDWLRSQGYKPEEFPSYDHVYENGLVVQARLYPNSILEDFRNYLYETWLPTRAMDYFKDRDPKALPYLEIIMPLGVGGQGRMKLA